MLSLSNYFSLLSNYFYDFQSYLHFSSAVYPPKKLAQLEAKIIARYHNIEKGLSFAEVRLGFGKEKIDLLFTFLDQYVSSKYDQSRGVFQTALSVLEAYVSYHEKRNYDARWMKTKLITYQNLKTGAGGTIRLAKNALLKLQQGNFEDLAMNRHSIRNFSSESVSIKIIENAVSIAQKAPSVCNRQSGRVYVVKNQELKKKVLELHKGNAGFGHLADTILIVTSDLRTFTHVGERYQGYIDGSLFGMSLVYALHSLGVASCMMNWSVKKDEDKKMHSVVQIPEHEVIVFLVAVGHYPETFEVAKSLRMNRDNIMRVLE